MLVFSLPWEHSFLHRDDHSLTEREDNTPGSFSCSGSYFLVFWRMWAMISSKGIMSLALSPYGQHKGSHLLSKMLLKLLQCHSVHACTCVLCYFLPMSANSTWKLQMATSKQRIALWVTIFPLQPCLPGREVCICDLVCSYVCSFAHMLKGQQLHCAVFSSWSPISYNTRSQDFKNGL